MDDIITELDSDSCETLLGTMSSAALSSVVAYIHNSCNDRGEDATTIRPLQSFVPIIEALPGLLLEDNTYYVGMPLISRDLKAFISYARRVEKLTLTDVGRDKYPCVSQDTITRLAHVRDVKNPLLPSLLSSLKHLRLVDVDSELSYIWFCLTPSLETLELSGIPQARQTTIATFLNELLSSTPRLAHLTLGPGRLSPSALQTSVRFEHLRELRITDAADALDFAFLQAVAALPELALFDIDARTAKYTPYTPLAGVATMDGHDAPAQNAPEDTTHISTGVEAESASVTFPRLTTLTVISTILVMHDLVHCLLPHGVENVSLTLVLGEVLPIPTHWNLSLTSSSESVVEAGLASKSVLGGKDNAMPEPLEPPSAGVPSALAAEEVVDGSLLPEVPYHTFKKLGRRVTCKGDLSLDDSRICSTCQEKREQRLLDAEKSNLLFQITHFASTIEHILEYTSPQSVYINRADRWSSRFTTEPARLHPLELPPAALRKLLFCPSITKLEIKNWVLKSVNETLLNPPSTSESPLPMQILHLPFEEALHSGVALSTFHLVARLYPHLLDFQTHVIQCASANVRDLELSISNHGLKELSFSGEAPGVMEDMMEIAPYICFLFPHLERIVTYDGHDTAGWKSVYGLVKMCQKVRDTEKKHLQLGA
ncbi:hypothetical protein HYPSUDRAFT_38196 [Hypholoma sublateritium FD-334 SS-4]|uniref:F-box domain-containing protein n=1 Tax=Hypholoma sublateritium (strain FD-334 SS-4) TaxID=945553 RepID=A0A0D2P1P6_HYPSF|nr:hypothetical protein HYPSUDRAFT_38196 [Hypholoma sublateritium FD-334 SS-4]